MPDATNDRPISGVAHDVQMARRGQHDVQAALDDAQAVRAAHAADPDADTEITDDRAICSHCRGTGRVLTTANYLAEIVAMLPAGDPAKMDAFVANFYDRLIKADKSLAFLFPADLVSGDAINSRGHGQRDMLLAALVGLLTTYDPDHPDSAAMQQLDTQLQQWGRSHTNFTWPDGSVHPPTVDHYLLVRNLLGRMLQEVAGEAWHPEHTGALLAAYQHAMTEMMYAAQHSGFTHPRQAREAR